MLGKFQKVTFKEELHEEVIDLANNSINREHTEQTNLITNATTFVSITNCCKGTHSVTQRSLEKKTCVSVKFGYQK